MSVSLERDPPVKFADSLLFAFDGIASQEDPRDPYPGYEAARARGEVREGPDPLNPGKTHFTVYRYDHVSRLMSDEGTFANSQMIQLFAPVMGEHLMIGMSDPAHARYRAIVAPAFRPQVLAEWESKVMTKTANDLIDKFVDRGTAEFVGEFCFDYPAQVIANILGLPARDYKMFQAWVIDMLHSALDMPRAQRAGQALRDYFAARLAESRRAPGKDFIGDLVGANVSGEKLSDEEIFSFLAFLLPAGIETTYRSMGSLLYQLLHHPEQYRAVCEDRSLVRTAIEESLRMSSPFQFVTRTTIKDTEIGGVAIPRGTHVQACIAAANRDPVVCDEPQVFNVLRKTVRHVSFGQGIHICLGLHLARLEMNVALTAIMDRLPNLRWDENSARRIDAHMHGIAFRSPTAVPAVWDVNKSGG